MTTKTRQTTVKNHQEDKLQIGLVGTKDITSPKESPHKIHRAICESI